jgi:hypothetical protein
MLHRIIIKLCQQQDLTVMGDDWAAQGVAAAPPGVIPSSRLLTCDSIASIRQVSSVCRQASAAAVLILLMSAGGCSAVMLVSQEITGNASTQRPLPSRKACSRTPTLAIASKIAAFDPAALQPIVASDRAAASLQLHMTVEYAAVCLTRTDVSLHLCAAVFGCLGAACTARWLRLPALQVTGRDMQRPLLVGAVAQPAGTRPADEHVGHGDDGARLADGFTHPRILLA